MTNKDIQNIKKLVSENKLEKAIQTLISLLKDEKKIDEVVLLSRNLNDLSRKERLGLLDYGQLVTQKNVITDSFLQILGTINVEDENKTEETSERGTEEQAPDEKRLALVIGCSEYEHVTRLDNPDNDATAMEKSLKKRGFDVIMKIDPELKEMKMIIDDFGIELKNYDVGLFYFAGHGVQVNGNNYLIPVDANLRTERAVEYDCVQANRILANMEDANSKVNIIMLDACRNNPFERSWSRSITGRGLAQMNAPTGSIIGYATAPGTTASDGPGQDNGLYTGAVLEELNPTPRILITEMFQKVRKKVSEKSNGQQVPWESTSLIGNFYI